MTHFSCFVITPQKPSDEELHNIMRPWHTFEADDEKDEYVVQADITDEVLEQFNKDHKVVVMPDGKVYSKYDRMFYTKISDDDFERRIGRKKFELPPGAEEKTISAEEARQHGLGHKTLLECAHEEVSSTATEHEGRIFKLTNPNSHWDWWVVGGRWTGILNPDYEPEKDPHNRETCKICDGKGKRLKLDAASNSMELLESLNMSERLYNDIPGFSLETMTLAEVVARKAKLLEDSFMDCNGCAGTGTATKWPTEWVAVSFDQLPINEIPLAKLKDKAEREALEIYDSVHKIVAGRGIPVWANIVDKYDNNYDQARAEYDNDPVIKDIRAARLVHPLNNPAEFNISREIHAARARANVVCPFAYVLDGVWNERIEGGWRPADYDESDDISWAEKFELLLKKLPETYWISVIDCHE